MKLPPTNKRIPFGKNFLATPSSTATNNLNYSQKDKILEVEYKKGNTYQYLKVPVKHWKEYKNSVLSGDSSGIFVNTKIKEAGYDYREVNP